MVVEKAVSCHDIAFTRNVTLALVSMQLDCTVAESRKFRTA